MMGILKKQLEFFIIFAFVYFFYCIGDAFVLFVDVVIVEIVLSVVVLFTKIKNGIPN